MEPLEPRVYLSGNTGQASAFVGRQVTDLAAISERLQAIGLDATVEVQTVGTAESQTEIIVVDVNGPADATDVLLATFDADTGELLGSVRVTEGQFLIVNNSRGPMGLVSGAAQLSTNRLDAVSPPVVARVDSPGAVVNTAPAGLQSQTQGNSNYVESTARDDTNSKFGSAAVQVVSDGAASAAAASAQQPTGGSTAGSPPIVVVFPSGRIPDSFRIRDELTAAARPDRVRDPARPIVISPIFPQWFSALNYSPWWSRAVELPGVQSRVGDLMNRGLDDSISGRRIGLLSDDVDALGGGLTAMSSRVVLRSPTHLMIFTTPSTRASTRGEHAAELAIYSFETGQLSRTGQSVTGRLVRAAGHVAFLSSEAEQGADLTGDGVLNAVVLQMFNPVTGGVRNTGIAAEALRSVNGQIILGVRETARNGADSPPPTDPGLLIAHRFDPVSGRVTSLMKLFNPADGTVSISIKPEPVATDRLPQALLANDSALLPSPSIGDSILKPLRTAAPVEPSANPSTHGSSDASRRLTTGEAAGPPTPAGSSGAGPDPGESASSSPSGSSSSGDSAGDDGGD